MNTTSRQYVEYAAFKAAGSRDPTLINTADSASVDKFRNKHSNQDLQVSTWHSAVPDMSAPRYHPLVFQIVADHVEKARKSALEVVYYLAENCGIPEGCVDVIYDSARIVPDDDDRANDSSSTPAEIVILVPPLVLGSRPTPLMPALNHRLARQMVDDGIGNIDVDVYVRDSYVPLPNSINAATGRLVIPLPVKELLYLDGNRILELSKQPRAENSMIMPQEAPDAVEWLAGTLADFERQQHRQNELRKAMLKDGWEIPACIRRLTWADLDRSTALEACRLVAKAFSFLGSNEAEIRYHIMRLARRNDIMGFQDQPRLRKIVTFGFENPWLFECRNELLHRFCPGKCFIAEVIEKYEKPLLWRET